MRRVETDLLPDVQHYRRSVGGTASAGHLSIHVHFKMRISPRGGFSCLHGFMPEDPSQFRRDTAPKGTPENSDC